MSAGSLNRTLSTAFVTPSAVTIVNRSPFCWWNVRPSAPATTFALASFIGPPAVRDTSMRACTTSPGPYDFPSNSSFFSKTSGTYRLTRNLRVSRSTS